ncbi:putative oxidoreductase YgbJ [Cytospora mali]|uniref:Oxidoreductase YgbJ n=1 Tax=Cytospora mali TaxID=578113 RepID=A0A194VD57_CYTMA|nr:putative oxidoreductase YgbJ [Valsa mali var. pyri (nom. inval.)]
MAASKPEIAFIGLGAMGFGMATNLVKKGYSVTGFDVWGPTLEKFKAAGGNTASTPAEAVGKKAFCVVMVATAQQAQEVLLEREQPAVPALPRGATILLCSTVPAAYVQGLAKQLVEIGRDDIHLVDSPVSGGAIRAADGTLSIMAGGSDAAINKGRDLLEAMADPEKLYIVQGPQGIGAGSNLKMCHQVLAANQILSASEALGFACHLGLDLRKASEAILGSEGHSWMFENRLPRLLAPDSKLVASAVTIILKDAGIITSEARRYMFPTPMTSVAEQVYFTGLGRGWGADDDASMIRLYSEGAGKLGSVKGLASSEEEKLRLVVGLLKGIHLCSTAEALGFGSHVGLDLDQLFELCINAAGGSAMLRSFGPEMIEAFKEDANKQGKLAKGWAAADVGQGLEGILDGLQAAVDEAQQLKMPLFLGNQALNMMRLATQDSTTPLAAAAVVKVWVS